MKKEIYLKNLAITAVVGLLLAACAHQESTQALNEGGTEESASSSATASLGDSGSASEEASSEFAASPSSTNKDKAPSPGMENTGELSSNDSALTEAPMVTEVTPAPSLIAPISEPTLVAPATKKVARAAKIRQALALPTEPIQSKGKRLNRYYIVRAGDDAETLAELFYDKPEKAADLNVWNPGSWKTGTFVFYLSPLQPKDKTMQSFYTERGMIPTEYEVMSGDTLATIALATYGSMDSWREIGLLNNIQSPEGVVPGNRIALFPADLSGYSPKLEGEKSASHKAPPLFAPVANQPVDKQIDTLENQITKLETDIKKETLGGMPAASPNKSPLEAGIVGSKPVTAEGETKDLAAIGRERQKARTSHGLGEDEGEADLASAEVASFFQQNLTALVVFLLAGAGLGIFLVVRRSRNNSSDL